MSKTEGTGYMASAAVSSVANRGAGLPVRLVGLLLWLYRAVMSPFLGRSCRFAPSCSVYATEAVQRFGVVRGGWLALKRVLRCHPFHPGGWDPVV